MGEQQDVTTGTPKTERTGAHAEQHAGETQRQGSIHRHDAAQRQRAARRQRTTSPDNPFIRAENEDDDGYDPYSDRRPEPEPLFERDPWS